jgi:3-phenylpropionate/trans-cinnamate dioxygenase ferredoxin subunit
MANWVDACGADELTEGSRRLLRTSSCDIALFNVQDSVYALDDSCPHQGSSLVVGKVEGTTVTCRAHGLRFDLATGCMRSSLPLRVRTYPVRIEGGRVQVDIASEPQRGTRNPGAAGTGESQ